MQHGDLGNSYYPYPQIQSNPPPIDHHPPPSYASAPPFSTTASYGASDYSPYPHNYPPFPHNSDPLPTPPSPYPPLHSSPNPPPPPQQPPESLGFYPPQPALNYPLPLSNSFHVPDSTSNSSLYPSNFVNHGSGSGYFDDTLSRYGDYGRSRSDLGSEIYGGGDDGVYAYKGKSDPYGARGTAPKSSTWGGMFDDYGRAISSPKEREKSSSLKVVRAVPKAENQSDVMNSGVQKFRVKLLPESGSQDVTDVLFQVGLDGIRMLDPSTSRTLRIYPLETVTRCDKIESSTFAFWAKTSVDIDPRRIRLQSNSYTTNTLLDTVTAAIVQFKEMGGRSMPIQSSTIPAQPIEKKKGLTDWLVKLKPVNEEKDHWMPDEAVAKCTSCGNDFSAFVRRHHCRNCGDIFCDKCTQGRTALTADENAPTVRVCDRCMAEVTRRLNNSTKEAASRSTGVHNHEDLAKRLQDEMERNRRSSPGNSGSKSDGSGRRMREVACPTCTVHLQVQVPSSGSETIECGVCQHPFLVTAH